MSQKKYVSLSKLSTFLDNLSSKFAALSHKHTMSDITDLSNINIEVDTELSSASNNPVANSTINAKFDAISQAFVVLEDAVDNHTHTKSEVGLDKVDNTADAEKSVNYATSAGSAESATSATKATQDASGNVITATYETKNDADKKLEAAKIHANNLKYAGSSSTGGSATSAMKLDTSTAGSTTQPVYFANGVPVPTTYTLGKSVPNDAVFTDTHYASKNVVGATNATSNTATALSNGAVYLNSVENGAVTSSHKISGSGATTVTTDASGNIVISSTDNNTTYDAAGSSLGLVKSGGNVTISSGVITVNDDSHNHTIANVDNLQSSLDSKQATITGGATTITSSNLTASRALVSDANGKVAVSDITSTELGYLNGVTDSIQTQLDAKLPLSGGTMTGEIAIGQQDGNGIQLGRNGRLNATTSSGSTSATVCGMVDDLFLCGNGAFMLSLRGSSSRPTYNGSDMALASDIPTNKENWTFTLEDGSTVNKAVYVG